MGGKIAILGVGSVNGLGAAIARRFADGGFETYVGGRDAARLKATAAAISEAVGAQAISVTPIPVDVTDQASVAAFFEQVGTPDMVAYNAGNNSHIPFLDLAPETFEEFWRVGAYGGLLVGQEAIRRMLPEGAGTITFTGASASRRGKPGFVHFAASKAALKSLAEAMAREFAPQGIHVAHVIIDGGINGDMLHTNAPQMAEARGTDGMLAIDDIAEMFWQLHHQGKTAWTFETELRPYKEAF